MASVHNSILKLPSLRLSQPKCLFANHSASHLALPRPPLSRSVLTIAHRQRNAAHPASRKNKNRSKADVVEDDDMDEDAFEALFKQLEEDLERDEESLGENDNDISEEDLALLERELEETFAEDGDLSELLTLMADDSIGGAADGDEHEVEINDSIGGGGEHEEEAPDDFDNDDDDEEEPVKLKGWQLRRLAKALKVGRRKTSIKNLATELCLDRAVVLELLRDPPPNLLMMSAALPDKPEPATGTMPDSEVIADAVKPEPTKETPIHVLQNSWSARKRLKKVHVNTLESVYRHTKRPTNAMIISIVQVTNLPRKRVVKWFEDKRAADGVPAERRPYRRASSQSVFTQ